MKTKKFNPLLLVLGVVAFVLAVIFIFIKVTGRSLFSRASSKAIARAETDAQRSSEELTALSDAATSNTNYLHGLKRGKG